MDAPSVGRRRSGGGTSASRCLVLQGDFAVEKAGDESTCDLYTQRLNIHEKTAWMLRSLLK